MNAEDNQQPGVGVPAPGPGEAFATAFHDPRVVEALEQYLAALEAGQKPNRQAFLARHAENAEVLAECLDGMEALHVTEASPHQPPSPLEGERGRAEAGGEASTSVEWQPGTLLGEFRIIREIGRGGMGVVYEAEQLSLGRRIALKVLPFAWSLDPRQLQRFKNEARAAAQLHHQHIVPVYAVGCERGVHFFAMQYIEGQTLAGFIRDLRQKDECRMSNDDRRTNDEIRMSKSGAAPETPVGLRHSTLDILSSFGFLHSSFFRTVAQLGVQ